MGLFSKQFSDLFTLKYLDLISDAAIPRWQGFSIVLEGRTDVS